MNINNNTSEEEQVVEKVIDLWLDSQGITQEQLEKHYVNNVLPHDKRSLTEIAVDAIRQANKNYNHNKEN